VYDAARKQTLVIGGMRWGDNPYDRSERFLSEHWAWNGSEWSNVTPVEPPPPRVDAAAAYDEARGTVVLFGGRGKDGFLGDTWEKNDAGWRRIASSGPPARAGHTLVYDANRGRCVLFGGVSSNVLVDDIWEWDGTAWKGIAVAQTPAHRPSARSDHAMAYDAAHGGIVVFGGASSTALNDTWLFRQSDPALADEACHSGFDGDGDGKLGCEDPDCAVLCAACGDGVCAGGESCRLCPGDCGPCTSCGDLHCDADETCAGCPGDCG